jgi:ferredoxin
MMRVKLDTTKCQGHGRCYALAPGVFDSDDEGYAVVKVTGELPPELQDAAVLAADNCPEFAIELEGG